MPLYHGFDKDHWRDNPTRHRNMFLAMKIRKICLLTPFHPRYSTGCDLPCSDKHQWPDGAARNTGQKRLPMAIHLRSRVKRQKLDYGEDEVDEIAWSLSQAELAIPVWHRTNAGCVLKVRSLDPRTFVFSTSTMLRQFFRHLDGISANCAEFFEATTGDEPMTGQNYNM